MKLSELPEVNFIDTDPTSIKDEVIAKYEEITKRKLSRADPTRLFLLALTEIIIHQRTLINDAARQNLLAYARGDQLDHIGVLVGANRIQAIAAKTHLLITLSATRNKDTIIPKGTRVAADDRMAFATTADTVIKAGTATGETEAICTQVGYKGNKYAIGEIKYIVDQVPYVASITNTSVSDGGADIETDDRYRARIQLAPEHASCAGTSGAYKYYAMTASNLVSDAEVISPSPGCVDIYVLEENGVIPEQELLNIVDAAVQDKTVKALTDKVTVKAPTAVYYNIQLTYYIDRADATSANAIQQAVTKAVDDYALWQKSVLGRDINQTELYYRIRKAGAKRASIASPTETVISTKEVAIAKTIKIDFGGLEDG